MTYRTYITEALVCGSRQNQTSDRSYLLFTREAGMLYAMAKSVREERSTQRFALQEFSYLRATLIHGRAGWRLTGVEPLAHLYATAPSRAGRAFVRTILLLIRRTLHGEESQGELFDDIVDALLYYSDSNLKSLETVLSLRILYQLGYVAPPPSLAAFVTAPTARTVASTLTPQTASLCAEAIEHALKESQL